MTIEELLELPAKDIASLTDRELENHLRKYFPHTRPAGVIDNALSVSLDKRESVSTNANIAALEKKIEEEYERAKASKSRITIRR